jgi:hypothetical protein
MLNLPPYMNISLTENSPNRVVIDFDVNYDEFLKYPERVDTSELEITENLQKLLSNYAGVEFGNPVYGEVSLDYNTLIDTTNVIQDWGIKVFNPKIKKKIKEVDTNDTIHSINFTGGIGGTNIKLTFKRISGAFSKSDVKKNVIRVIRELGYGPNLTVSTT